MSVGVTVGNVGISHLFTSSPTTNNNIYISSIGLTTKLVEGDGRFHVSITTLLDFWPFGYHKKLNDNRSFPWF